MTIIEADRLSDELWAAKEKLPADRNAREEYLREAGEKARTEAASMAYALATPDRDKMIAFTYELRTLIQKLPRVGEPFIELRESVFSKLQVVANTLEISILGIQ